ncbi:hypothetical protein [Streptomyces sp. NPDC057909]|uniref:hypothetical protein n=1 Tax=Streptomyces sp. NPDC057909 TaxID=3346277 RepID=UPI0036E28B09
MTSPPEFREAGLRPLAESGNPIAGIVHGNSYGVACRALGVSKSQFCKHRSRSTAHQMRHSAVASGRRGARRLRRHLRLAEDLDLAGRKRVVRLGEYHREVHGLVDARHL